MPPQIKDMPGFVKELQQRGYDDATIKGWMSKQGWDEPTINSHIGTVQEDMSRSPGRLLQQTPGTPVPQESDSGYEVPDPEKQQMAATAVRWGVPAVASAMTAGLGAPVAIGASTLAAGASEYAAKLMEKGAEEGKAFGSPDKEAAYSALNSAFWNVVGETALPYVGRKVLQRSMFKPNAAIENPNVEVAGNTLQKISEDTGKPLSMSVAGSGKATGLGQKLEEILRGSFLAGGKYQKFDQANQDAVQDALGRMLTDLRAHTPDDVTYANILREALVGTETSPGKFKGGLENWAYSLFTDLYDNARMLRQGIDAPVGMDFLIQNKQNLMGKDVFAKAYGPILSEVPDTLGTTVPLEQAIDMKQNLNKMLRDRNLDRGTKNVVERAVNEINKGIDDGMIAAGPQGEMGLKALRFADTVASEGYGVLTDKMNKALLMTLKNKPEVAVNIVMTAPSKLSALNKLEEMYQFAAKNAGSGVKTGAFAGDFEMDVLEPMKSVIVSRGFMNPSGQLGPNVADKFSGAKLKAFIDGSDAKGVQFLDKVFAAEGGAQKLRDLATTLDTLERQRFPEKMIMRLIEGGALTGLGLHSVLGGGSPGAATGKAAGAIAGKIVVGGASIAGLMKLLTNPGLLQRLQRDVLMGPAEGKTAALMTFLMSKGFSRAAEEYYKGRTPEASEFYERHAGPGYDGADIALGAGEGAMPVGP